METEDKKMAGDMVDHPDHYNQGGIECIDALESLLSPEAFDGFCRGNAIKYLWRSSDKDGRQDLQKAQWYLNRLLEVGDVVLLNEGVKNDQ